MGSIARTTGLSSEASVPGCSHAINGFNVVGDVAAVKQCHLLALRGKGVVPGGVVIY